MTIVRPNFRPLKVVIRKSDGAPVKTVDCKLDIDNGAQSHKPNSPSAIGSGPPADEKRHFGADVLDFARFRMH